MYLVGHDLYLSLGAFILNGHTEYFAQTAIAAVSIVVLIFISVPFISDSVSNSILARIIGYSERNRNIRLFSFRKLSLLGLCTGLAFGIVTTPLFATLYGRHQTALTGHTL